MTNKLNTVSRAGDEKPERIVPADKKRKEGINGGRATKSTNRLQSKIRAVTSIEKRSMA